MFIYFFCIIGRILAFPAAGQKKISVVPDTSLRPHVNTILMIVTITFSIFGLILGIACFIAYKRKKKALQRQEAKTKYYTLLRMRMSMAASTDSTESITFEDCGSAAIQNPTPSINNSKEATHLKVRIPSSRDTIREQFIAFPSSASIMTLDSNQENEIKNGSVFERNVLA